MNPAVLVRDLDRVLLSTLAGEAPTYINPTNTGIKRPPLPLNKLPSSNSSLGVSLVGAVPGDVDGVPTLISPNLSLISIINDNYCVGPTPFHVVSSGGPKVSKQSVSNDSVVKQFSCTDSTKLSCIKDSKNSKLLDCKIVSYLVVDHAPIVLSHGPPQKKGVSPNLYQSKIKHAKGVCCVSPCLSAPYVLNIPNAVAGQTVGGRLQNFWQVWQEMGANPRVVSVLRYGYIAFLSLMSQLVVEKVVVKSSLAFYNRLFLVPNQTENGGQS